MNKQYLTLPYSGETVSVVTTANLTPEPDTILTSSVYRISLPYKAVKTSVQLSIYHEYVRVYEDESIEEVIKWIKEKMFYDFTDAPLIEGVNYSLFIKDALY